MLKKFNHPNIVAYRDLFNSILVVGPVASKNN